MYAWIWRRLPGPLALRLMSALLIVVIVVYVLFAHVFPWEDPRLPFNKIAPEGTGGGP